jgi:hypothetical protein
MLRQRLNQKVKVPVPQVRISKSNSHFSAAQLILFALIFFGIGGLIAWHTLAAAPEVASLQAEQMSLPTGATVGSSSSASGGQYVRYTANGTAMGTVNIPSTTSATGLAVTAHGSSCSGWASLSLTIDGSTVIPATAMSGTSWKSYLNTSAINLASGSHSVGLVASNISNTKHCHRYLYADVTTFYGPAPAVPVLTITSNPTTITSGQSSTISWNATNATSCAATSPASWTTATTTNGNQIVTPNISTTYSMTCTGAGGSANASVAVTLNTTTKGPQTTWATCTNGGVYAPLSDSAAAGQVTHQAEVRPYNARSYTIAGVTYPAPNSYVPNSSELTTFQGSHNQYNQTPAQANPYLANVDGLDGLTNPSTDDLIQWAAHKWGIPEDWLRAEYIQETSWNHYGLGDRATETASDFAQYPIQARVPGSTTDVYESMGITQIKWRPDGSDSTGTEPLRWKSMAFNIDYQAAAIRFYYDDPNGTRTSWGDASYARCQPWNSIGGWFEPYPWNNSGQQSYISSVQAYLNNRTWTTSSFINQSFTFPAAITFN